MAHICVVKLGQHWFIIILASRLFGTRPICEPMQTNFQLDLFMTYFSGIRIKIQHFYWRKYIWKCRLQTDRHFVIFACPFSLKYVGNNEPRASSNVIEIVTSYNFRRRQVRWKRAPTSQICHKAIYYSLYLSPLIDHAKPVQCSPSL